MNTNLFCSISWVIRDVPLQIWEAETVGGHAGPVILTRLFHNKILFYLNNLSRCYLSYLSPDFIFNCVTIIGALLVYIGIYFLVRQKKYLLILIFLSGPLFPLLEITNNSEFRMAVLLADFIFVAIFGANYLAKSVLRRNHI